MLTRCKPTRGRVSSRRPRYLVNDNGKGKLESVAQEPFAVILDASSVQSVTSLGGEAQAGTSIEVEPHISEADYLQLTYSIELSNFTRATPTACHRQPEKLRVDSSVTIPDGYTIVVGGLATRTSPQARTRFRSWVTFPFSSILFGTRQRNVNDSTLFVFIKPVILRDDKFADLKYLSGNVLRVAELPGDFPEVSRVPMR